MGCRTSDKCLVCRLSTASGAKRSNECSVSSSKTCHHWQQQYEAKYKQGKDCPVWHIKVKWKYEARMRASGRELKVSFFVTPAKLVAYTDILIIIGCLDSIQGIRSTGMLLGSVNRSIRISFDHMGKECDIISLESSPEQPKIDLQCMFVYAWEWLRIWHHLSFRMLLTISCSRVASGLLQSLNNNSHPLR